MIKIPLYQPCLLGNEEKYVNDCLDSNWISSNGKYVKEFEQNFAEYIQLKYAKTVSNVIGTFRGESVNRKRYGMNIPLNQNPIQTMGMKINGYDKVELPMLIIGKN